MPATAITYIGLPCHMGDHTTLQIYTDFDCLHSICVSYDSKQWLHNCAQGLGSCSSQNKTALNLYRHPL